MQKTPKSTKVKAFKSQVNLTPDPNSFGSKQSVRLATSSRFGWLKLPPPRSEQQEQHKACSSKCLDEGWFLGRGPTLVPQQSQQRLWCCGRAISLQSADRGRHKEPHQQRKTVMRTQRRHQRGALTQLSRSWLLLRFLCFQTELSPVITFTTG